MNRQRGQQREHRPAAAEAEELWSPEHDWILQFDSLLKSKKEKSSRKKRPSLEHGIRASVEERPEEDVLELQRR